MSSEIKIAKAFPLLPSQRGLVSASAGGYEDQYRQQICIQVLKPVDTEEIIDNIRRAVSRHEALRSIFDWSDEEPMQVIVEGLEPVITDAGGVTSRAGLMALLQKERQLMKPLDAAPPLRFLLVKEGASLFVAVTYHHIILDGPAIAILLDEILTGALKQDVSLEVYAEWLAENLPVGVSSYWRDRLQGLLDTDGTLSATPSLLRRHYQADLGRGFYDALIEKSSGLGLTPAAYMQALWSEWALQYFNKRSLLYGLVTSARLPGLTEEALGSYISTLPWLVHSSHGSFDEFAKDLSARLLEGYYAKHLSLGEIIKKCSPNAMNFDSLLTISTNPVGEASHYQVVETYENTGYKLAVDIDVNKKMSVRLSSTMPQIEKALDSFIEFSQRQVKSSARIATRYAGYPAGQLDNPAGALQSDGGGLPHLVDEAGKVLGLTDKTLSDSRSFLELGGDSILALRLKMNLKNRGYDVSVADILREASLKNLARKIYPLGRQQSEASASSTSLMEQACVSLGKEHVIDLCTVPDGAFTIIDGYRKGYGADFHEQTAFLLKGALNTEAFGRAIKALGNEYDTLRLAYLPELPDVHVLTDISRTSFEIAPQSGVSFEEFHSVVSRDDLAKPFRLEKGPLLRVILGYGQSGDQYLFMSFPSLVTDGWSFSTLLKRLFVIYNEMQENAYTPTSDTSYFDYSKEAVSNHKLAEGLSSLPAGYEQNVVGENISLDAEASKRLIELHRGQHKSMHDVLLELVKYCLMKENFNAIMVYQNGRDDTSIFESVGPYSHLSATQLSNNEVGDNAYFVFENYPRDDENSLKNGDVASFAEHGNWRRDLLPPQTKVGFLFDLQGEEIVMRILVRESERSAIERLSEYEALFMETLKEYL